LFGKNIVRNFANINNYGMIKETEKTIERQKQLALFAKALGHPTRVAIMEFLLAQESCYFGDIHEVFPNAKATISQHLKELKNAGLIHCEIETPKVKYCIDQKQWEKARQLFNDFFATEIIKTC
jgi:DNA-binding transcriptional ArsR family regulator